MEETGNPTTILEMENLWHQFISHWRAWGINGIVAGAASTITWLLARRKEWKQGRREKTERQLDSAVPKALGNRDLWRGPRVQTGAGMWGVKSDEMAEYLKRDQDEVADAFERLEARGRVSRGGGSMMDPAPWWFIVPR